MIRRLANLPARRAHRAHRGRSGRNSAHQPAARCRGQRAGGDAARPHEAVAGAAPRPDESVVRVVRVASDRRSEQRGSRFVRNRVRHEVLPLLSDVANRDVVPLLVRTADVLRDDDRLLDLPRRGDRPDGRPGTRCCRSGARSPGPAGVDRRRSLSAGRGHPRPGDGRGPRRRPGLRPRRRPTPPTPSSAPGNRRHRVPSKDAGRAVTSANGMGSPWVEIGTLVASPAR